MPKRLLNWTKWVLFSVALTAVLIWLCVYVESVYQRKKAERFLSELAMFPFATADFAQVRQFNIRHGGGPIGSNLPPGLNACSLHECQFGVEFLPASTRLLRSQRRFFHALFVGEDYLALRPWVVATNFTVTEGILQHTHTIVATERMRTSGDHDGPVPIYYQVDTDAKSTRYSDAGYAGSDYVITRPHVTGGPADILEVWALHQTSGPWKRSFDIRLDCVTRVVRGCVDFRELAPSTWADYEHDLAHSD